MEDPKVRCLCVMSFSISILELKRMCLKHGNTQACIPTVIRVMMSSHVSSLLENSIVYSGDNENVENK